MCKTNPEVDVTGEAELDLWGPICTSAAPLLLCSHCNFCRLFSFAFFFLPQSLCVTGGFERNAKYGRVCV